MEMSASLTLWIMFGVIITVALFVDLVIGAGKHRTHAVELREALGWTFLWLVLAMGFAGAIAWELGRQRALEFVTGYLVELSLSVDNLFVFILIFHYFKIPVMYQPRVLQYGILGAVIMRLVIIFAGVSLLQRFHWIFYIFGAMLLFTAVRMMIEKDEHMDPSANPVLKIMKRFIPMTHELQEDRFIIVRDGKRWATPLMATLAVVEFTDLVFAVDSIPAVLAISTHTLVVFTSNVFAILGLRSLYSVVSGFMSIFRYLRFGLSCVLIFIGGKMLTQDFFPVPIGLSLGIVMGILSLSVIASILIKEKKISV